MNMHDLIELEPRKAASSEKAKAATTMMADYESFCRLAEKFLPATERRATIDKASAIAVKSYSDTRRSVFIELGFELPKSLLPSKSVNGFGAIYDWEDGLNKAVVTPRAGMKQLRTLCDDMSFIIAPIDFHDKRSYASEHYGMQSSIKHFRDLEKLGLGVYVISPLQYYDVQAHVTSENPNRSIYSRHHQTVLTTVALQIPMFQSVVKTLNDLRSQVREIDSKLKTVEHNVGMLRTQFDALAAQVAALQEAELTRKAEVAELSRELAEERALNAMTFSMLDPMAIAIPGEANIATYDGPALIGPCWGPDFNDMFKLMFTDKGQGDKITKALDRLY